VLAEAARKTGRAKADFELREISREEYERISRFFKQLEEPLRDIELDMIIAGHAPASIRGRAASAQSSCLCCR
jgi:hypothetical protein